MPLLLVLEIGLLESHSLAPGLQKLPEKIATMDTGANLSRGKKIIPMPTAKARVACFVFLWLKPGTFTKPKA